MDRSPPPSLPSFRFVYFLAEVAPRLLGGCWAGDGRGDSESRARDGGRRLKSPVCPSVLEGAWTPVRKQSSLTRRGASVDCGAWSPLRRQSTTDSTDGAHNTYRLLCLGRRAGRPCHENRRPRSKKAKKGQQRARRKKKEKRKTPASSAKGTPSAETPSWPGLHQRGATRCMCSRSCVL